MLPDVGNDAESFLNGVGVAVASSGGPFGSILRRSMPLHVHAPHAAVKEVFLVLFLPRSLL